MPAPVQYRLSGYGKTVLPLVEQARVWGMAHLARLHGPDAVSVTGAQSALGCAAALAKGADR